MAAGGRRPRSGVRRHSHLAVDGRLARFGNDGRDQPRSPLQSISSAANTDEVSGKIGRFEVLAGSLTEHPPFVSGEKTPRTPLPTADRV